MQSPTTVQRAVKAIWATLAMSAISAVVATRLGEIDAGQMTFNLLVYALLCVLPFKIGNGSNVARYVYLVLCCLSVLVMFAGVATLSTPDWISALLQLPLMVYAIYQLFLQPESSEWFANVGDRR